jgi:hypothetical protein
MRQALKFLGGSIGVYAVMAACATEKAQVYRPPGGPSPRGGTTGSAGAPEGPDSGGATGTAGETVAGGGRGGGAGGSEPRDAGLMDAMTNPVPDAMAQPEPVPTMSGTRLKARYMVGEDGSKQWNYGWYDSERKENCTFTTAGDGKTRCLPTPGAYVNGSVYADAACTQEVAAIICASPAPKYISVTHTTAGATCAAATSTVKLHAPGAEFAGPDLYLKSGANCIATMTAATNRYYFIGAEIQASSFVQGNEQIDDD